MMDHRLIVCDVDGTLLNSSLEILPGTRAWLTAAQSRGLIVMLASGRPVAGLHRLVRRCELNPTGMILAGYNGAYVVEADSRRTLTRSTIPLATARRVAEIARSRNDLVILWCHGNQVYTPQPQNPSVIAQARENDLEIVPTPDLDVLDQAPDAIVCHGGEQLGALVRLIRARLRDEVEFSFASGSYIEITAHGATKGSALRRWCSYADIPMGGVIAFGDHDNDIPMLEAAGLAVAMGNATPAVKAVADVITHGHDDEGIAAVLSELAPSDLVDTRPAPAPGATTADASGRRMAVRPLLPKQ
ncbi:hypothetical protein SAMN05421595_2558 [Austwickia chelonae]|uniref:Putative hydrolase n=1 Tax=Austwickia chelonae NBRC 105200 TaxID=1184607 RepID=K6VV81_9MICO|nr:Cof-type HAD-IIB family hydrolase [Austwickia chelonae]GAB79250.1 putative hydrolase [Austwickia chelonae NBRC 105200]SEW37597.1 hypothetical protein SAMN05421595_2558 [Austwickia chelonae]